jgi:2-polyprenyl-3-methyl-5-hydroxy-6-metoxy-1,4-benzoquinol methylase
MNTVGSQNESNRIKWLEKTLKKIPRDSKILDAGAGEQQFKKFCSHLNYVSQDFAQYDGAGDSKGLQVGKWDQTQLDIVSDIIGIPEPDESFDVILCTEVFEHLPEPILAIKEFSRLLRPDGCLILTAPFCSLTHFSPYHFYTGFNRYFYETHLPAHGFKIIELESNGNFFEYLAQEIRRISYIAEVYAKNNPTILEKLALKIILRMLEKFSTHDKGSEELLHFGYHILAVKI